MKIIEHTTDINAPADTTWAILSDFAAYDTWNPFMTIVGSASRPGDRLTVTVRPGKRTMTFKPTVTEVEAGSSISWLGRFVLPHVCDGAHELHVEDLGNGRSRFTQRETFRGVLVPFMKAVLRDTDAGFAAMNAALAIHGEELAARISS
jgi:hypothetical protein